MTTLAELLATSSDEQVAEFLSLLAEILTTKGDMIVASAANTPSRLAKGTAYQSLNMKSDGTLPEWQASLQSLLTAGGIIYGASANTPANLPKGTSGQVLVINSSETAPEWSDNNLITDESTNQVYKLIIIDGALYLREVI